MLLSSLTASAFQPFGIRSPRLQILANGVPVAGAMEAEVTSNNHYAAEKILCKPRPRCRRLHRRGVLGLSARQTVEVQISLDGGVSFASLIQGAVDQVDIDFLAGAARISGRDLTAALIESRTQETFANQTSSEIAQTLAQRHNLTAQVTKTTTPVGRYYQNEHDRITLDQFSRATTEWDLLVFLARQEGFDIFVRGTTLFFQPPSSLPETAILLEPSALLDLRLERALTLARDIEVTVKSWNSRQQSAFAQTARAHGGKSKGGSPQRYVYVRPNLTPDQALKLSQQLLAEITRHERVISATMPGELTITPRSLLTLQGTGTEFDQTYHVDEIERHLRFEGGFTQRIRAKNLDPHSQATPPADIVASVTG